MSVDYKARVYRPELFEDTNKRTSYSKMHRWLAMKPTESFYNPPMFAGAQPPVHTRYYKSGGYDDFHKAALKESRDQQMAQAFPLYGPTAIRNGQYGSGWRHVKEVQPAAHTEKQVFIDGQISCDDNLRSKAPCSTNPPPRPREDSLIPRNPNFTPRMIELNKVEKIEKLEFEDLDAQKGIEYNNWHLLR